MPSRQAVACAPGARRHLIAAAAAVVASSGNRIRTSAAAAADAAADASTTTSQRQEWADTGAAGPASRGHLDAAAAVVQRSWELCSAAAWHVAGQLIAAVYRGD